MDNKTVLKSNFTILFNNLKMAINQYLKEGYLTRETKYVEAYLAATIHALMDYADKYLDSKSEIILACKYANNTLKHNELLITHEEIIGGFSFPISFPIKMEKIQVVWNYDASVKTRHQNQQDAFKNCFAGRPILETLLPVARLIEKE